MPPASAAQGVQPNPDRGLALSSLLGTDYERKKNKLNQELQLDFRHYLATKKDLKTREPHPQTQGLSLPINEKLSVQKKLREERKREYNLFLQEKAEIRRLKRGTSSVAPKHEQIQASEAVGISRLNTRTSEHSPPPEHPASRRDAATLTESVDIGKRTDAWSPGHRGRRRWRLHRPQEPYRSEEELSTDREEEFRHRRRHTPEPEYKEERRTTKLRADRAPQDIKEVKAPVVHDQNNVGKSDPQMPDSMRPPARSRPVTSKDKAEFSTGLMIGAPEEQTASQMRKEQYKQELLKQMAEQQQNKIREKTFELRVAASGATDPEKEPNRIKQFGAGKQQHDSWRQDVPYKPEIDPEAADPHPRPKDDKPTNDSERRGPPAKSHMDYNTTLSQLTGNTVPSSGARVSSLDCFNEAYHRDFSNMIGEVAMPRVAGVPPPAPPTVTNNYKTPYDAAYYYYGTRNPLDPNPPHNQNSLPEGLQQSGNIHGPRQRPPPPRLSGRAEAADRHRSDQHRFHQRNLSFLDVGERLADRAKERRENALSYQEALRQQIKEKEERKRREKEEKERYDAKKEAEMVAYIARGRSGGGDPIKDQNGNLVSDLNQMHRMNEEPYKNHGQTGSFLMRNADMPGVEARAPLSHPSSGFNNQPTTERLSMQDRYKEDLKQQIEENKRKREEERERTRIEEEIQEKRLADERIRIQQQYEEEQRRQKKNVEFLQHRLEKQSWIHEPKAQNQEAERTPKKVPESTRDREEKRAQLPREPSPPIPTLQRKHTSLAASRLSSSVSQLSSRTHRVENQSWIHQPKTQRQEEEKRVKQAQATEKKRETSPPIPTLQRKHTSLVASRPSSAVSQLSSRTERSVSAPHPRPVPAKTPQLQDGQQDVIRELSALRRYLRKEQRQLEVQLGRTDRQESHYTPLNRPRGQPRADVLESTHGRDVQPSKRSPSSGAACANMQNIREFNQLKYRGTASREEVRHMYPEPPTDARSLDIQQQALLREQQRKIRLMKREQQPDFLEEQLSHYPSRDKPGRYTHRDSLLPSETTFHDFYSGDAREEHADEQRPPQQSAERRARTVPRRRRDYDEASTDQRNPDIQPDAQPLQPVTALNQNQHLITRQDSGDHNSRSDGQAGDEVDVSPLHSAPERRVSVETVATEPWLRPGTSDAVKRSGCRETPDSGTDAPPWLTQRIA